MAWRYQGFNPEELRVSRGAAVATRQPRAFAELHLADNTTYKSVNRFPNKEVA